MKTRLKLFFSIIAISALTGIAAQAAQAAPSYYNYANSEAEYSVMLPEAPTVKTIWTAGPETTPYLENPPTNAGASLGESATFERVDMDTEEVFYVKITFLKATHDFLQGLTSDKIQGMLHAQYKKSPLSNEKFTLSPGSSTLKWGTLSGFTLDAYHHPAFAAMHYLTGQQSILVVQVLYSIENKTFQDYYNTLVNSITYNAP